LFLPSDDYFLGWIIAPFFFTVVLPFVFLFIFYMNIVVVLIYSLHGGQVRAAYGVSIRNAAFELMAAVWVVHSRIWHGE